MANKKNFTDIKPTLNLPSISNFNDIEVDYLEIKDTDYRNKFATFDKVTFKDAVFFENVNLSNGMSFDNCDFESILVFTNVIVDMYDPLLIPNSESIIFNNCQFHSVVNFNGENTNIQRSLVFDNCIFQKGLNITNLEIKVESLKISNSTINGKLDIFNSSINQDIRFSNNKINTHLRLGNNKCSMIAFTQANTVIGNLHIDNCKLEKGIVFNDGAFKEEIFFSLNETHGFGLSIIDASFEKTFYINYHSGKIRPNRGISKYFIASSKFANGMHIMGTQDIFQDCPKVDEISLNISPMLSGTISFGDLDLGALNITGFNTSSKIIFKHIQINHIKIKDFINECGIIFSDVRASRSGWENPSKTGYPRYSAIYVDDSNFGKAQFFQTNFKSFDNIILTNVIINEISTSLVTWFTEPQLERDDIKNDRRHLKNVKRGKDKREITNARMFLIRTLESKKDIYKQLKFVSQRQGDMPKALEFQSYEMNYYRQIVKYEKPRKFSEHFILATSLSNNFGQNWIKALWLLIIFSFLSCIPITLLTSAELDYTKFDISFINIIYDTKVFFHSFFKIWMVLLNPTHRIADIDKNIDNYSGIVYFLDMLSRVVVSYFIFQMVSAFRKFSK